MNQPRFYYSVTIFNMVFFKFGNLNNLNRFEMAGSSNNKMNNLKKVK